jgi:hypothetical protein
MRSDGPGKKRSQHIATCAGVVRGRHHSTDVTPEPHEPKAGSIPHPGLDPGPALLARPAVCEPHHVHPVPSWLDVRQRHTPAVPRTLRLGAVRGVRMPAVHPMPQQHRHPPGVRRAAGKHVPHMPAGVLPTQRHGRLRSALHPRASPPGPHPHCGAHPPGGDGALGMRAVPPLLPHGHGYGQEDRPCPTPGLRRGRPHTPPRPPAPHLGDAPDWTRARTAGHRPDGRGRRGRPPHPHSEAHRTHARADLIKRAAAGGGWGRITTAI